MSARGLLLGWWGIRIKSIVHIYIDESGSFITPATPKQKVSCVAALVVPSSKNDELLRDFAQIRPQWGGRNRRSEG
jgi:hypothetical protein